MTNRLDFARDFILKNARVLERQLFAFHFETGTAAAAARSLRAYQNPDGGYGNALEPDKRVPASQPQDCEIAFRILDSIGLMRGDYVMPVLDWLESITTPQGGVPFSLPSANDAPHAPWWGVKEANPPADLNPTAALAGLVLKHGVQHAWLGRASDYCFTAIAASKSTHFHELACSTLFLAHAPDRARAKPLMDDILNRISQPGVVAMDPDAIGYVQKPLDFAPRPDSPLRPVFSDADIKLHVDHLAASQKDDGGWPISWDAISPGVELEWRGRRTIEALLTLRAYGLT